MFSKCLRIVFLLPLTLTLVLPFGLGTIKGAMANTLKNTQKIAAATLRANEVRQRVASENMANAESSGYAPKSLIVRPTPNRQTKVASVEVKKITQDRNRTRQKYDPTHPKANQKGYVTLPDINPLVELMNIQNSKHGSERALRVYEVATDLRHKTIGLMSGR